MAQSESNTLKKGFKQLQEYSAFLLIGTVAALIWANVDHHGYHHLVHDNNVSIFGHDYNLFHFFVNDVFMVFFFGIAMKEVSESFLPGGALSSLSKASMPAISTMGGVFGPIGMFFVLTAIFNPSPGINIAWAVPTATDIAYSWLFAGLIFGRGHPAVTFLLVLAVLDDLIGMLIIAVFYTPEVSPQWLGLVVLAMVICELLRRAKVKSFWPYVAIGAPLCWFGLMLTGVHAALALVPIIPFMPHAGRDVGIFTDADDHFNDTMNLFEHFFKPIVDFGLIFFGIANAGVVLSGEALTGSPTWIIFCSLLIGKTLGIIFFSVLGLKLGLKLPKHMELKHIAVLGAVAGIGFTVALFVTGVALTPQLAPDLVGTTTGDMLKLGALLSFAAGPIAWIMAKVLSIEKIHMSGGGGGHH